VIRFTLKNCRNLDKIDFSSLDYYNDGLTIELTQLDNYSVFETTDRGNIKLTALCDKIEKEELEFSSSDYIYLIKKFTKQRDEAHNSLATLNVQIDSIMQYLYHEIDVISRKIQQAGWLTDDRKHL
jgi:hypothetical protein